MPKGDHLGEFEHLVALALLRLTDDAYGMHVRREIEARTGRSVSIGSVYATLDRLEKKGLARARFGGSDDDGGGRARKYFHLTRAGAQALLEKHDTLDSMTEGLALRRDLEAI